MGERGQPLPVQAEAHDEHVRMVHRGMGRRDQQLHALLGDEFAQVANETATPSGEFAELGRRGGIG
jgi:hypothetical protein